MCCYYSNSNSSSWVYKVDSVWLLIAPYTYIMRLINSPYHHTLCTRLPKFKSPVKSIKIRQRWPKVQVTSPESQTQIKKPDQGSCDTPQRNCALKKSVFGYWATVRRKGEQAKSFCLVQILSSLRQHGEVVTHSHLRVLNFITHFISFFLLDWEDGKQQARVSGKRFLWL